MKPRTRVNSDIDLIGTYLHFRDGNLFWTHDDIVNSQHDVMNDYVTKNYHELVAQGLILNNPMSHVKTSVESSGGYSYLWVNKDTVPWQTWTAGGAGSLTLAQKSWDNVTFSNSYEDLEDARAKAKQKAISNVEKSDFSFGEDLGELKQTLRFLKNPLDGSLRLMKRMKKDLLRRDSKLKFIGNRGDLTKRTAQLTNEVYLSARFAWNPLIRSIADGRDALHSLRPKRPERRVSRFSESVRSSSFEDATGIHSYHRTLNQNDSVSAGILFSSSLYRGELHRLGLSVRDIPETVWAVMPYSFMVDRVFDLTSTLKGIVNLIDPRIKIHAAWTKTNYSRVETLQVTGRPGLEGASITGDVVTYTDTSVVRDPWIPTVRDTIPRLKVSELTDTLSKATDLLSLLNNFRKR